MLETTISNALKGGWQDTIYSGTITPKDKSLERVKELMFTVKDDLPDHSTFPKVKADMEIVDSDEII